MLKKIKVTVSGPLGLIIYNLEVDFLDGNDPLYGKIINLDTLEEYEGVSRDRVVFALDHYIFPAAYDDDIKVHVTSLE